LNRLLLGRGCCQFLQALAKGSKIGGTPVNPVIHWRSLLMRLGQDLIGYRLGKLFPSILAHIYTVAATPKLEGVLAANSRHFPNLDL
jgi:hypothetical protein